MNKASVTQEKVLKGRILLSIGPDMAIVSKNDKQIVVKPLDRKIFFYYILKMLIFVFFALWCTVSYYVLLCPYPCFIVPHIWGTVEEKFVLGKMPITSVCIVRFRKNSLLK